MVHHKPYNRSLQKKRKTNPLRNCCRPTTETPAWMLHVFSFSSINVDFHISSLQIFNTNSKVVVTPERLHNFFNPPKVSLPDVDASPRKTRVSFEATVDKVSSIAAIKWLLKQILNSIFLLASAYGSLCHWMGSNAVAWVSSDRKYLQN